MEIPVQSYPVADGIFVLLSSEVVSANNRYSPVCLCAIIDTLEI